MLLGLRKIQGISIREYKSKFHDNPIFIYKNELEKLINQELVEIDGDNIKLTNKGLDFANIVWKEFVQKFIKEKMLSKGQHFFKLRKE